jgi:hypothetical protein
MILFTVIKSDFSCVSQVWSMNRKLCLQIFKSPKNGIIDLLEAKVSPRQFKNLRLSHQTQELAFLFCLFVTATTFFTVSTFYWLTVLLWSWWLLSLWLHSAFTQSGNLNAEFEISFLHTSTAASLLSSSKSLWLLRIYSILLLQFHSWFWFRFSSIAHNHAEIVNMNPKFRHQNDVGIKFSCLHCRKKPKIKEL